MNKVKIDTSYLTPHFQEIKTTERKVMLFPIYSSFNCDVFIISLDKRPNLIEGYIACVQLSSVGFLTWKKFISGKNIVSCNKQATTTFNKPSVHSVHNVLN